MKKPIDENTIPADGRLVEAMVVGPSAAIEASEARGQRELVSSESLPTDGSDDPALIELGFSFGEPFADDPIFRPAKLPEGWRKERSDHSMWSYVVDAEGNRRVSVFYKAAFYDRSAFMRLERA